LTFVGALPQDLCNWGTSIEAVHLQS
jgi:hypothetical protein